MTNDVYRAGAYAVSGTSDAQAARVGAYAVLVPGEAQMFRAGSYAVVRPKYPPYSGQELPESPFIEATFPECLSYGSSGGPGFKNNVFILDSGHATRAQVWDQLRARYEISMEERSRTDIEALENFFYATRGQAIGFRFKDWLDYYISNQTVAVGDGATTSFQIFKRYPSGPQTYDRMLYRPVSGSLTTLYLDGVPQVAGTDFHINYATGTLTFATAPTLGQLAVIDYLEFDIPVRFNTDMIQTSAEVWESFTIPSVPLIEIKV